MALELLLSYAPEDQGIKDRLMKHLDYIKRQNTIIAWREEPISEGVETEPQSLEQWQRAKIILLLISADYLAASSGLEAVLTEAIQRQEQGKAHLLPILLKPVYYEATPFAQISPLPQNNQPINKWNDPDEACAEIAKELHKTIQAIFHKKETDSPISAGEDEDPDIPVARTPYFTGREQVLASLHHNLRKGGEKPLPQVLSGPGGSGKTQIALEYASMYRADYDYIFWVRADSPDLLNFDLTRIARQVKLPDLEEQSQTVIIQRVTNWLQRRRNWLLIFDNANNPQETLQLLPTGVSGHVLLTSQNPLEEGLEAQEHKIEPMTAEEGSLLLLRRAKRLELHEQLEAASPDEQAEAQKIVELTEGHPLALTLAGAYIKETRCGLNEYLERYQAKRESQRKDGSDVSNAIVTAWSLSVEKIRQISPTASEILFICALLYPESIPEAIIVNGVQESPQSGGQEIFTVEEHLNELRKYALIDQKGQAFTIHRSGQAISKESMDAATQKEWKERIIRAISQTLSTSTEHQLYFPHMQRCADWIKEQEIGSEEAVQLLIQMGKYVQEQGQYQTAEQYLELALSIGHAEEETLETAERLDILVKVRREQGNYQQARSACQQALTIRERLLEPSHLDIALSLNKLAVLYHDMGKHNDALPLSQRALSIHEQVLDPQHPEIAASLNNLALLYKDMGKHNDALPLYQRALAIREQTLGSQHPDIATVLNNLAMLYRNMDRYDDALPLSLRALSIYEQVLGPLHPNTATSLNNLAALYHDMGKHNDALPLYQRALAIREQILGPLHPDTATSLNNLAALYQAMGKFDDALPLYQRALSIREQTLDPQHPDIASSLHNLARLYQDMNKLDDALPLYQRALSIREQVLDPLHPHTALSLNNLAVLYHDMNKLDDALPLYQRALSIREQVLDPQHPDIASSLHNLARLYQDMNKLDDALPLFQRALAIREQVLGPLHPDTTSIRDRLTRLQQKSNERKTTSSLSQPAPADREEAPDISQINTDSIRNNFIRNIHEM